MGLVLINHPDHAGAEPARTSREAFDLVWQPKGYFIVEDEDGNRLDQDKPKKPAAASGGGDK